MGVSPSAAADGDGESRLLRHHRRVSPPYGGPGPAGKSLFQLHFRDHLGAANEGRDIGYGDDPTGKARNRHAADESSESDLRRDPGAAGVDSDVLPGHGGTLSKEQESSGRCRPVALRASKLGVLKGHSA